jgi:hypothetical protein
MADNDSSIAQATNKDNSPEFRSVIQTAPRNSEALLGSVSGVNVGAAAANTLLTVPSGKNIRGCVITRIALRNASASFNQATDPVINVGWNAVAEGVVASATLTSPTAAGKAYALTVKNEHTIGVVGDALKFNVTTACTDNPTTCDIDVFGYYY